MHTDIQRNVAVVLVLCDLWYVQKRASMWAPVSVSVSVCLSPLTVRRCLCVFLSGTSVCTRIILAPSRTRALVGGWVFMLHACSVACETYASYICIATPPPLLTHHIAIAIASFPINKRAKYSLSKKKPKHLAFQAGL